MVRVAVNDETDCENIIYALKRHFLFLHLLVDGICSLCADFEFVLDSGIGQFLGQRPDELLGEFDSVLLGGLQLIGNEPVLHRVGKSEVNVLQFALDIVKS